MTAPNTGSGPIIHWKAPTTSWVTLVLRPIDDRTWASSVDLGTEDGTHQLQCMIIGAASGGKIIARTYWLVTPSMKLTETGDPEIWNQGAARNESPATAMVSYEIAPRAPNEPKGRVSSVLAGVIVFSINLVFLFGVGVGFMVHRRRKAHHDLVAMHEIHQKFVDAGLMGSDAQSPAPVEAPKIDVTEVIAAVAVVESMNATIDEAANEGPAAEIAEVAMEKPIAKTPEEGVDIRKATKEEEEKIDMNDLSF